MTKNGNLSRTVAASSLTAAVALLVGLTQANAQAPAPAPPLSGAGSFPNSFIVPGTNTSLHVGGFIQLDARYDMSSFGNSASPGADDNLNPTGVSLEGNGFAAQAAASSNHGVFRMTAQSTRFQLETRTPTAYGEVKTFIEMDFAGSVSANGVAGLTNTTTGATQTPINFLSVPRLKQAYGTLGPWAFGQFASNFADLAAWSDNINGAVAAGVPMGPGTVFVPQVRYTYLLPNGITTAVSIESFQTGGMVEAGAGTNTGGAGSLADTAAAGAPNVPAGQVPSFNNFNAPGVVQKIPAVTGMAQIQQPWGHAKFSLAVAQSRIDNLGGTAGNIGLNGIGFAGSHIEKWGYQLAQTGHFNTIGQDKITWNVEYGQGAANYSWDLQELGTQWLEDLVCTLPNTAPAAAAVPIGAGIACSQPRNMGLNVGYSHFWTSEWRSTADIGYNQDSRPNAAGNWNPTAGSVAGVGNGLTDLERRHESASVATYWTPVPGVQLGIEYEWYLRQVWSGAHGEANRLATQALFAF